MKKSLLLFLVLLTASTCFAQEVVKLEEVQDDTKQRDKGEMKFEKTRHNFGVFAADTAIVTYTFEFTNVGKSPIIIHEASASCGCTAPDYPLEPIQPGSKGKITVTYNGKGRRPGVFRKSITIHNNGKHTPVRLYIEGEMIDDTPVKLIQDDSANESIYKQPQ